MKLTLRSKAGRGHRVDGRQRLALGTDAEEALFSLQGIYADALGRPVSRAVVVRRALQAHSQALRYMHPDAIKREAEALMDAARV